MRALKDNAKDICMAEAKGAEKIAKADLEAQYKPSARNTEEAAVAKGDAAYDVAKEKCDDLKGNDKDVCVKEAKAAQVKAKEDALEFDPARENQSLECCRQLKAIGLAITKMKGSV